MAKDQTDGVTLSKPGPYFTRMFLFLILVGFLVSILAQQLREAFMTNPALNGLIVGVLTLGILYALRQVLILSPEVKWVNAFRKADPGLALPPPPRLLAPMATMLGDRKGRMTLGAVSMRSLLDSIGSRLDESREISRYMIGLLIFLGLLGTFWGLLTTVSSIGDTIASLNVESTDGAAIFADLRAGLEAPIKGMGTAFSSSLFGLTGSLILGFLDLQAGQAQNRFYNELEEWLSTVTNIVGDDEGALFGNARTESLRKLERIEKAMVRADGQNADNAALMALSGQIAALTDQIRAEQDLMRRMAETQALLRPVLERVAEVIQTSKKG